jgi:tetratricopeptide (TPR) repeat protein
VASRLLPTRLLPTRRSAIVLGALAVAIALAVVLSAGNKGARGAPYVPAADSVVVEELPARISDDRSRTLALLRKELAAHPDDVTIATRLARLDIQEGRARSDPRYMGYAQAALAPWWDLETPPPPVLLLRATIRQNQHDFDRALADLDALVKRTPDDPQAWLTRSVVLGVRGRYDEAKQSCLPLAGQTSPLVVAVCKASVDGLTGDAKGAYARLTDAMRLSQSADERAWAESTRGELAERLGDTPHAEESFKAALTSDPNDAYVLGAYADLLLDVERPAEAAALVRDRTINDALLLRLALAEKAMRARGLEEHTDELRARFEASHMRGDVVHRREEARFELGLLGHADQALDLAKANWEVQHEPWDVRVLLESALAAHDPAAASPALEFLDAHHLEDPVIHGEAERVRAMGGGR